MRRVFTRQTREFGRHRGEISKRVLAQLSAIIPFRDSSPVLTITRWYLLDQGCTFHLCTSLRPPRLLDSRLNSIQDDGLSRGSFSGCPRTYFLQMVHTLSKGYGGVLNIACIILTISLRLNTRLESAGYPPMTSLVRDLSDGVRLIQLMVSSTIIAQHRKMFYILYNCVGNYGYACSTHLSHCSLTKHSRGYNFGPI